MVCEIEKYIMAKKAFTLLFLCLSSFVVIGQTEKKVYDFDQKEFQSHIFKILEEKEILERLNISKKLVSKKIHVSLGEGTPFSQFMKAGPIKWDNNSIYLLNSEEIFFHTNENYLRVVSVRQMGDVVVYEVVTHSDGKAKNKELYCMFKFQLVDNNYVLVNKSINEVTVLSISWL